MIDFRTLLQHLVDGDVRFILVGGFAATVRGSARTTIERGLNFTLTTSAGDLDLLGEVAGSGPYEQLPPHSDTIQVFGLDTRVVTLARLIHLKRAAGRPKDLEAIAELELLQSRRERDDARDD